MKKLSRCKCQKNRSGPKKKTTRNIWITYDFITFLNILQCELPQNFAKYVYY